MELKFSITKRLEKNRCIGDCTHEELCDLLIQSTEGLTRQARENIFTHIEIAGEGCRWIHWLFGKTEMKKLCAMIKSKTLKTLVKKYNALVAYEKRTPYTQFFNRKKIDVIWNIVQCIATTKFKSEFKKARYITDMNDLLITEEEWKTRTYHNI